MQVHYIIPLYPSVSRTQAKLPKSPSKEAIMAVKKFNIACFHATKIYWANPCSFLCISPSHTLTINIDADEVMQ